MVRQTFAMQLAGPRANDKPGQAKTQKNKVIAVAGVAFPGASVENWALDGWAAW